MALQLNPDLAETYYNRALASTITGKDAQAMKDATMAVELGFDLVYLRPVSEKIMAWRKPS